MSTATLARPDTPRMEARPHRIESLDILRGFALLGMILIHFHAGFRTTTPDTSLWPGEWLVGWVAWLGVEQKAAATFAFLFGVGFAIVMRRAAAQGRPVVAFYLRRLAVLALIGVAVEAFTVYVILVYLALWGVPLLLVRNLSTRRLLVLTAGALLAVPLYTLATGVLEALQGTAAAQAPRAGSAQPETYAAAVAQHLAAMQRRYLTWRVLLPGSTFALFLTGLLAVRHDIIDEPRRHVRLIAGAMIIGAVSWVLYWAVLPLMPDAWHGWSRHAWPVRYGMGVISDQWLAFTYMGALVLLLALRPPWKRRLAPFGTVGRMALTNYVLQAGVIYFLASPFGLGLRLRPYYYVLGAALLFALLALGSRLWLARFRAGPLEWVWRALTDLRLPELRVPAEAPATAMAGAAPQGCDSPAAPAPRPGAEGW